MSEQDSNTQKSSWWRQKFCSVSERRLEAAIHILQAEIDVQKTDEVNWIEKAKQRLFSWEILFAVRVANKKNQNDCWQELAQQYLHKANRALYNHDPELGWPLFKAAYRAHLYTASDLQSEANTILREAKDEKKKLSTWRKESIIGLLSADEGKTVKQPLEPEAVVKAQFLLDEQLDNTYYKSAIVKNRLQLLTLMSFVVLIAWIIFSPPVSIIKRSTAEAALVESAPPTTDASVATTPLLLLAPAALLMTDTLPLTATTGSSAVLSAAPSSSSIPVSVIISPYTSTHLTPRIFWLSLILAGMVGATISGFTAAMQQDVSKSRIPEELSTSTLTFARLGLAAVSAVAISLFLTSGLLKDSTLSYELLLASAVAAGFSERFLIRAMSLEPKA